MPRPLQSRAPIVGLAKSQKLVSLNKVKQNRSDVKQQLQQTLNSLFSQININIGIKKDPDTDNFVSTNQVNLLKTTGTYGINDKVKRKFVKIVSDTDLTVQPVDMDREHLTTSPLLYSYGIPQNDGGTYFILRPHHKALTKVMDFSLPVNFGYGTEKSNAIDFH